MFSWFRQARPIGHIPTDAIDQVIRLYIAPVLKREGFKKVDRTWVKEFTDYSFVVNVQANKWNSRETAADFTINYGIYIPSTYQIQFGMPLPKLPKEYDCIIRERAAKNSVNDFWWRIRSEADIEKIGTSIDAVIHSQCLALFNKVTSLADVAGLLRPNLLNRDPWGHLAYALLEAELGNVKRAQRNFAATYRAARGNEAFQSRVKRASAKYGIRF